VSADRFRVDPLVVMRLGEELISDETQALLELIKNAYDADASYARVAIHTEGKPTGLLREPASDSHGWIEISDDGTGMGPEQIRDGWLLIARSGKREFKESGQMTAKKRTPLGDKGLGRLGSQRLGWGLQIATKTAAAKQERVLSFSWEDFVTAESLDKVEIVSANRPSRFEHGTVLTISELREPERWSGDRIEALQRELSGVISPYGGIAGFTVAVTVDGTSIDMQSLSGKVLDTAKLHYDVAFDGETLAIKGRATLGLFRPPGGAGLAKYRELVEADEGAAFYEHLVEAGSQSKLGLAQGRGRWFVTFERQQELGELAGTAINDAGEVVTPGPFTAELDAFSLASGDDETEQVFGALKPYREFIKGLAGIRVYRDGFLVRTDADWLKLGEQWTTAKSYYGLKPDTTLGYVAISGADNGLLLEKTDREGFVDDPAYRNFYALLTEVRRFTEEVQELLRRDYLKLAKERAEEEAELEDDPDPEDVSDAIDETLAEAQELKEKVAAAEASVSQASAYAQAVLEDGDEMAREEATQRLLAAIGQAQETLARLAEFLQRLELAQSRNRLLREEINQMREQLDAGVEAMSLGLTAEALSHEMFTIADGLSSRTATILEGLNDGTMTNAKVRRYVQYVRGSVNGLRTELGHFSPALRYVRERRESIELAEVVAEVGDYYRRHWESEQIELEVVDNSKRPFTVKANRGRVTQVLDNLLLNSAYWVRVAQHKKAVKRGRVTITLNRPRLTIRDNGPGVEPSVESSLFDPFVTRKPRGQGRGLGLFIVRQLLASEDCTIELSPRRGKDERRREFVVNLGGMLDDD
jgi:signal transduction histidine kinase